jgi:hypothetical protein
LAIGVGKSCHSQPIRQFLLLLMLPAEVADDRIDIGKVVDDPVWLVLGQLVGGEAPGRDRNRARADRFAAGNVVGRVADHIDICGNEIDGVSFERPALRERPQLVAVVVIVRESAKFEEVPEPVMAQLQLRAAFQIASEKTEHVLRPLPQSRQEFADAGQDSSRPLRKLVRQSIDIEIEKRARRRVVDRDLLFAQNLVHNSRIGPARDFDPAQVVGNSKLLLQDVFERLHAGSPRIDQRAVDIEKKKPGWRGRFQIRGFKLRDRPFNLEP